MKNIYPRFLCALFIATVMLIGTHQAFAQTNIQVTKLEVSDTAPNELQNLTIEINVKNNGPQATTALQVQYLLPSSMTFVSFTTDPASPGAGTYTAGTGIWNIGPLSSGSTVKLFIVAFPKSGTAGTTISTTASYVSSTPADNNASDNSLSLNFTVNRPDIEVTKLVNTSDPDVGNTIIYTINAKNVGLQDAPATGLVITDLLPAGLTYTTTGTVIPAGTTYNPATGAWTIGTLADNVTVQLKIAAVVNAGTTGQTITNTASVTTINQAEESTVNNTASVPITVRFPDIQLTKTVSNGPYNEGSNLTYTITVRNNGPASATNVKVEDDLVSALAFVSASATQGTYNSATDIWDVGALASGQSRVLTIVAAPVVGSSGTSVNNTAQLLSMDQNDPLTANNSASVEIEIAKVDLLLEKTVNDNTPDVGQTITFSLNLTNSGPGLGSNIIIKDVLPAGLTFVALTSIPAGTSATQSGGTITWTNPSINSGSNRTLQFTATVAAGFAARTITNTATVESFQQVDPDLNNNTSAVTFIVNGADLRVSKVVSNVAPNPGDNITYTIVIKNNGPLKANDITLNDLIPTAGLTFVSSTISQGNAYNAGAGTWFANDINSGDSATLTITATVKPAGTTLGNSYTNTASIGSVVEPDGITANNSASALFAVGNADLGITKSVSSSTSPEGGTVTYTLTVQNFGPHNAPLVVANDLLPPEVTYTSHSGGTYNPTTGVWTIGTLNNGATTTLTINTTVNTGTAAKTVLNTATVSSPMNEPPGATNPNTATATFKVNGADIAVTKTASATLPVQGDPLTYTVTATNNGPDATSGLVIIDVLPTNLTFLSSSATAGSYASGSGLWTIGTLANGASATLTINTKITNGGGFTNTAFVQNSSALDANTVNNTASVFTSALKSFTAGACIIDMGVVPQTINNGMKPYGLVYELVKNLKIPIYWAINPSKSFGTPQSKVDQPDFTVAGVTYSSGAFIIPAEFVPVAQTTINSWVALYPGLKVDCNRPAFNAPIHDVITSFSRAVLDEQNGDKAISAFYDPAGVPATAYRADGQPSNLTTCDDVYTLPHADPQNWVALEKTTLDNFIKAGGWLFMACHSVSALESLVDLNGDGIGDLNYLSNAGLIPWGQHSGGTIPPPYYYSVGPGQYAASVASDPFMQFLGRFDGALQNGSEQINIPKSAGWRSTTTVAVWDHDHPQVVSGQYPPGPAAALAYGRAFGNPAYGMIMEFTSHTFNGGTVAENVAAGRTYGNFLLQAGMEFKPQIIVGAKPDTLTGGSVGNFSVNVNGRANPISYQWTSSCGGTFGNPTAGTTTFTAPNVTTTTICIVRLTVTDGCGRENFEAFPVILNPIVTADLSITKTDGNTTYTPGSPVTYTVVVGNTGPSTATNAVVSDNAPTGTTISSWTAVLAGGATGTISGTGNINQTVTVPSGATITYTINLTVPADITGSLANTATVTPSTGTTDPNTANNTATDTDTANPQADLSITKTDGSTTYTPGSPITYTAVVSNAGPSNVVGATVVDNAPAGTSISSWTALFAGGASGNGSGSDNISQTVTVPVGGTVTYSITLAVPAGVTGDLTNTATITAPAGTTDPTPANNTATDTDTANPQANLGITKSDGSATYTPGIGVTYTVVVTNVGPSNVTGATVVDNAPAGTTIASWTAAFAGSATGTTNGTGDINQAVTIPVGGTVTYTVNLTVPVNVTGDLVNTATVAPPAGTTDPVSGNNSATDTDTQASNADLSVTKTDGTASYVAGTTTTYTIVVSNAGPSNVSGASFVDNIPSGTTWSYTSTGTAGTSGNTASGAANISDLLTIPSAGSVTYTVVVTIPSSFTGNLVNTATITPPGGTTDPTPNNNTATDSDTGSPQANLAVTKTDGTTTYISGTTTTYTIVVSNAGPSNVVGASFVDNIPSGTTWSYTSSGTAGTSGNTASGSANISDLLTIPNGGSVTYTVVVTIPANFISTLVNTATVTPPAGTTDPVPDNNTATDTDTNSPRANLEVTKTDGTTTYISGTTTTYTIVVSNGGPNAVSGASFVDNIPSGTTWSYTSTGTAGTSGNTASGTTNISDLLTLPSGGSVTYTAVVTIPANFTGDLVNTATITPPAGTTDPVPGNNTATDTDTNNPQADLVVTKTDGSPTFVPGTTTTYTVVASNNGPNTATGATFVDNIPSGVTWSYTSVDAGGASGNTASGTSAISDALTLPNGGSVTYSIVVTIPSSYTGNLVNTATITPPAGITDPTPGNNSATDTDTPSPQADLSVTKTDGVTTYVSGSTVTYTIVASNGGPSDVTGTWPASFTDNIPAGVSWSYTSVAAGGASGNSASGSGNISDLLVLPSGGSVTYSVTISIPSNFTANLVNTATITPPAGTTDPNPGNNTVTDTDTNDPRADLKVSKTDGKTTYTAGTTTTYTVVVSNNGPNNAVGATLVDNVPAGVTWSYTSTGTAGTSGNTASGIGNINEVLTIPSGGNITYTITASIPADFTGNLVNTATVAPPAGVTDPDPGNNTVTDTDTPSPQADLMVTKTDGTTTYTAGNSTSYTVVVTNSGPSNVAGASFVDNIPAGTTWSFTSTGSAGTTGNTTNGTTNINDLLTIPTGGNVTYTVTVLIPPGFTGNLVNTATITPPAGTTDPNPGNNTVTDINSNDPQADLMVTKTDGTSTFVPGTTTTYTVVASNAGPSNVVGASFVDNIPLGTTWSYTSTGTAGTSGNTASGAANISDLLTIPNGGSVTYTVVVTIPADFTGNLTNTATITSPAGVADPTSSNNTATDTDTPSPQADLVVTKSDGTAVYVAGTTTTYTIVVGNTGPSDVADASFIDNIPAGVSWSYTSVAAGGASGNLASGTGNINRLLTIPVGGTITYTVVVSIPANFTGNLVNTAAITPPTGTTDPNPGNNTVTDTDSNDPQADLEISKTDGTTTYTSGTTTTYTVVASNNGPSNVVGATLVDNIPAGVTWSYTSTGTAGTGGNTASGTGNINEVLTIPSGGRITYTISVAVPANFTGNLVNTATIAPPVGVIDPISNNNTVTDTDTPSPQADFAVTKTDGMPTYVAGTTTIYTVVVSNSGPSDGIGNFTDNIPAGTTWSYTSTGTVGTSGNSASGTGNITNSLSIPSGGSVTYTVTVTIPSGYTGNLVNTATITPPVGTDLNLANNTTTDTDTPSPEADLALTKTNGTTSYIAGTTTTYTIVVSNNGPSNVLGASFTDNIPAGTSWTYTSVPTGGASGNTASGSGDISDLLDLPNGGSITYTVTVTIPSNFSGSLVNTATITPPVGTTDPVPGNNSVTDTDVNNPQANLGVTKTDGTSTYVPGTTTTYTVVVSNGGSSNVAGASFVDNIPAGTTWTYMSTGTAGTSGNSASGSASISDLLTIPSGGTITYTLILTIPANFTGNLVNTATVTPPAGVTDPVPANNTATDMDTPTPEADLALTKTDGSATYIPGGTTTYTLVVTNNGPSTAMGASLVDNIPAGTTWNYTSTGTAGTSGNTASGSTSINDLLTIPSGGSITYTINLAVPSGYTGNLVNTASVTPPTGTTDPNPGNNSATDTDTNNAIADLVITKTDGSTTYTPGSAITYTIIVSNNGPSGVMGASIVDIIPATITGVSWSTTTLGTATVVSGSAGGGNNLAAVVNLPAGGGNSVTFKVIGTVSPSATGNLTNNVTVTPPTGTTDLTLDNNSATDTDTYKAVIVASYDNLGAVASGGTLVKPLFVNDTLNGAGNFNPSLVNITVTDAPNNGTATINPTTGQVTYTPNAGASGLDNLIYQICDKLDPTVCDTALVVVTITPVIDAVKDIVPPVLSGGTVTYPLITNDTLNRVGNFDPTLVTISIEDPTDKGTATINPTTGQVTYIPTAGFSGPDSLLYKICDKLNPTVCDMAWVYFTITPVIVASYDNLGTVAAEALVKPLIVNDTLNGVGQLRSGALVNITITVTRQTRVRRASTRPRVW